MGDLGAAGKGAAGGAATGAAIGSVFPGYGTAIGAGIGAVAGGVMGYFSAEDATPEQKAQAAYAALAAQNYAHNQLQVQAQLAQLQKLQSGQSSVSAEQLRQAMQQSQAQQMSMAAGATPQNAVMAMRQASINAARTGSGLAGQQAVAGLAERNQATMSMNALLANNGQLANSAAIGGWAADQVRANQQYQQSLNSQNQMAGMLSGAAQAYAMSKGRGGSSSSGGGG